MHYLDIELDGIDSEGNEKKYKLSDFKGENIIVYFYPQDDTPVCTKEANKFKEAMAKLKDYAKVIGVSNDDIENHKEFREKYKLNFALLSDKMNKLKEAFTEHQKPISQINRSTLILDKDGNVIKFWEKVDVDDHIEEIIEFFEKNK